MSPHSSRGQSVSCQLRSTLFICMRRKVKPINSNIKRARTRVQQIQLNQQLTYFSVTASNSRLNSIDDQNFFLQLQGATKEVIEKGDDQYLNFTQENAKQTQDVIGKHIYEFPSSSPNQVPTIFILLLLISSSLFLSYFEVNPHLYKTEGLFRKGASLSKLDEIQIHISMGNYYYLLQLSGRVNSQSHESLEFQTEEPHVVANFLKKILKCMGEPLCSFALYNKFRDLSDYKPQDKIKHLQIYELLKSDILQNLRRICSLLPEINRKTFIYLIKFLRKVIQHSRENTMTLHNMSTVITPNLFRPFDLTANDLIFA